MNRIQKLTLSGIHRECFGQSNDWAAANALVVAPSMLQHYLDEIILNGQVLTIETLRTTDVQTMQQWCQTEDVDYNLPFLKKGVELQNMPFSEIHQICAVQRSNRAAANALGVDPKTLQHYLNGIILNGQVLTIETLRATDVQTMQQWCQAEDTDYNFPFLKKRVVLQNMPFPEIHHKCLGKPSDWAAANVLCVDPKTLQRYLDGIILNGQGLTIETLRTTDVETMQQWCQTEGTDYNRPSLKKKVVLQNMPFSEIHDKCIGKPSDLAAANVLCVDPKTLQRYLNGIILNGQTLTIKTLRTTDVQTLRQWCQTEDADYNRPSLKKGVGLQKVPFSEIHDKCFGKLNDWAAINALAVAPSTLQRYLNGIILNGQVLTIETLRTTDVQTMQQWCQAEGTDYNFPFLKKRVVLQNMLFSEIHDKCFGKSSDWAAANTLSVASLTLQHYLNGIILNGQGLTIETLRTTDVETIQQWCQTEGTDYNRPSLKKGVVLQNVSFSEIHEKCFGKLSDWTAANALGVASLTLQRYLSGIILNGQALTIETLRTTEVQTMQQWCQTERTDYNLPFLKKGMDLQKLPLSEIHGKCFGKPSDLAAAKALDVTVVALNSHLRHIKLPDGTGLNIKYLRKTTPQPLACNVPEHSDYNAISQEAVDSTQEESLNDIFDELLSEHLNSRGEFQQSPVFSNNLTDERSTDHNLFDASTINGLSSTETRFTPLRDILQQSNKRRRVEDEARPQSCPKRSKFE